MLLLNLVRGHIRVLFPTHGFLETSPTR
jgi:hypothetical protein